MPTPAEKRVIEYIVSSCLEKQKGELPGVEEVSIKCSVSDFTVFKALEWLTRAGKLLANSHAPEGNKLNVSHKVDTALPESAGPGNTSQIFLKSRIKSDILNGKYRCFQPLPSLKECERLYDSTSEEIKSVFRSLTLDGVLDKRGASYYLHQPNTGEIGTNSYKIRVIVACSESGEFKINSDREREFFQQLSAEANRLQFQLEIIGYNNDCRVPVFHVSGQPPLRQLPEEAGCVGYIVSTWSLHKYEHCLYEISKRKKPVAIWKEDHYQIPEKSIFSQAQSLAFFDIGYGIVPGRDVAQHIWDLGHRKAAFISPFHQSQWSQNRLNGLKEIFAKPGCSGVVDSYTLDQFENEWSFTSSIDNELRNSVINKSTRWKKLTMTVSKQMERIETVAERALRENEIYKHCHPLFEKALENKNPTIWVLANDMVAIMAMDFLNRNDSTWRERLQLVSFDNTFETLKRGISSYYFNTEGMVRGMVYFLLHPTSSLYVNSNHIIRLRGNMVERASTWRLPDEHGKKGKSKQMTAH